MRTPKNIELVKASYLKDYIYIFEFSNGEASIVNFKPMLTGVLSKFLDVTKFKKMKFTESGDIYWGKNWDMCFLIESYYKETKVVRLKNNRL